MFVYCLNSPTNGSDPIGTCSNNRDCGRSDCPSSSNYIPYTVSIGGIIGIGIGPLSMSFQVALVTDSEGVSEIQISYSAPNIFSSGLPSVDEMLADIASDTPQYKFGISLAGTFTVTNAPSVSNLYGPTYSVEGAFPGVSVNYNAIPIGDGSDEIYSGITIAGGMISPGVSVTMSNTIYGISVPFSVFDIAEAIYNNGLYGGPL